MDKLKGKLGELDIGKPSAVWGGKKVKTVGKKVAKPVYGGEKLPNPYKFTYIKGANKEDISISGLRPTRVRLFGKAKKMVGGLEGKKITIAVYEEKSEWKLKIIDCAPGMKVKKGNKFNLDAVEETA